MTRFVSLGTTLYNTDRVDELRAVYDREARTTSYSATVDGQRVPIDREDYERAAIRVTTIPAQPGFVVLEAVSSEDGVTLLEQPVIGWRVDEYANVEPVVLDGLDGDYHVEQPDGRVLEPGGDAWESRAALLNDLQARQKIEQIEREREAQAGQPEDAA